MKILKVTLAALLFYAALITSCASSAEELARQYRSLSKEYTKAMMSGDEDKCERLESEMEKVNEAILELADKETEKAVKKAGKRVEKGIRKAGKQIQNAGKEMDKVSVLSVYPAFACTGIALPAKDGSRIVARTTEWGNSVLNSLLVVSPRGRVFTSMTPSGNNGMRFFSIGIEHEAGKSPEGLPSATQWTSASDQKSLKFYYLTAWNSTLRCVELRDVNFSKVAYHSMPLDRQRSEPVEMLRIR